MDGCVYGNTYTYSGGPSSSKLMHGIQSMTVSWLSFLCDPVPNVRIKLSFKRKFAPLSRGGQR